MEQTKINYLLVLKKSKNSVKKDIILQRGGIPHCYSY